MKKSLLFFCFLLAAIVIIVQSKSNYEAAVVKQDEQKRATDIIGCAPGADDDFYTINSKYISVLPGWGNHSYAITTTDDSAQIYFNQGLTMYYSYHMREAVASFKEAARFDSSCAMIYWGHALASGPTYNGGFAYKMGSGVPAVIEKMNRYAANASQKEKDLIRAMAMRYDVTDTADQKRDVLNVQYAEAPKQLVAKYKDDIDIKAFYIDAVMIIHPWDFWYNDGNAKAWTPELVKFSKDILQKDPQHPAALHYYIHLTEASRQPEVALASADSLIKLFPGVAHMVHMSSHEYERIGYYAKGVDANEKADRALVIYDSLAKGLFPRVHVSHYFAVDAYCAISGAMYNQSLKKAITCRNSVEPSRDNNYMQYLYMFPMFAKIRMGKWQDILHDTSSIDAGWTYALLLNDFAKGMAYSKTGNQAQAEKHLNQLREKKKDSILHVKFTPYLSSSYECADVAENILHATILFNQKKYTEAFTAIEKAILAEDKLLYAEPKIWMLPARQYFGAYLMQLNKWKEAEKVYREDLVWNPGNGWSLLGLHQALKALGKTNEQAKLKSQYLYSFSHADQVPTTSAY